jgi:hypothetical protein
MKKYVYRETVSQELESVTCNMCGTRLGEDAYGHMDEYLSVEKRWDYHSPYDGETHRFDICPVCYAKLIGQLKIPPEKE